MTSFAKLDYIKKIRKFVVLELTVDELEIYTNQLARASELDCYEKFEAHQYEEFAMYHTATLIQEIQGGIYKMRL